MRDDTIVGYVTEGEFWCPEHTTIEAGDLDTGHISPVFAGDEGADDHSCRACLDAVMAEQRADGVPNFDAMTREELMQFWQRYHRPSRRDAAALVGDRRAGYTNIASSLASYACNKAVAIRCREEGNISSAACYEQHADMIYQRLPADLRW
jgi:hypothetical protein